MIDRHQIHSWEHDSVTLHLKNLIQKAIDFKKNQLADGIFIEQADISQKYSYEVGFIAGLKFTLEADLYPEEENIDEIVRDTPYSGG